jgi:uncharacterized membrane protein
VGSGINGIQTALAEVALHLIILLILFVALAAIIIWVADWMSVSDRRSTAVDILNRRLRSGEIDRAEYEEKRKLLIAEDDLFV